MIEHESQGLTGTSEGPEEHRSPVGPGLTPDSQQATRGERCLAGLKQETPS